MSSCFTGGGRAYKLDLEIILKSPSTSWTSQSSSPSSTLSESSNSPIAISTRKPRTPRKRPNQTYNEAAALLSTAYPKIFSAKHPPPPHYPPFPYDEQESSDLVVPRYQMVEHSGFLLHPPLVLQRPPTQRKTLMISNSEKHGDVNPKGSRSCTSTSTSTSLDDDFDAESTILDEEIEEGAIDSIMGKLNDDSYNNNNNNSSSQYNLGTCYGFPIGLGFEQQYDFVGMRNTSASAGVRPLKNVGGGDWWRYPSVSPSVNVVDITPKFSNKPPADKKKKKKMVELRNLEASSSAKESSLGEPVENATPRSLILKLNYDNVLDAWSDKDSPFSDEFAGSDNDVQARLAQIDLFSENGGIREASVLRYKEKRRTRLFSKKIRYQVRKVNADRRPRMKGRFVKSPNSPDSELG